MADDIKSEANEKNAAVKDLDLTVVIDDADDVPNEEKEEIEGAPADNHLSTDLSTSNNLDDAIDEILGVSDSLDFENLMTVDETTDEPKEDADADANVEEEKPEDGSIQDENVEETEEDITHPYLYLLENFQPPKEQTIVTSLVKPKNISETPVQDIYTRDGLMKLIKTLRNCKEIGVDYQLDKKGFQDRICLLEICTKDSDYIIDVLKLRNELLLLTEIFINPKILKIFFKAQQAVMWLQLSLNLFVVNIFDMQLAMNTLEGKSFSFYDKIRDECGYVHNMKWANYDYSLRPLSVDAKSFVRARPHYLLYCYHSFKNQLIENDKEKYDDVLRQCNDLCKVLHSTPVKQKQSLEALIEEIKNRQKCELVVAEKLFEWRAKVSKSINKNPEFVLNRYTMKTLAVLLPATEFDVLEVANHEQVRRNAKVISDIISEARRTFKIVDSKRRNRKKERIAYKINKLQAAAPQQPYLKPPLQNKTVPVQKPPGNSPAKPAMVNKGMKRKQQDYPVHPGNKQQKRVDFWANKSKNQMQAVQNINQNNQVAQMLQQVSHSINQFNQTFTPTGNNSPFQNPGSSNRYPPPPMPPPLLLNPRLTQNKSLNYPDAVVVSRKFSPPPAPRGSNWDNKGIRSTNLPDFNKFNPNNQSRQSRFNQGNDRNRGANMEEAVLKSALMVLEQNRNELHQQRNNFDPNRGAPNYEQDLDRIDQRINELQQKVTHFKPRGRNNNESFRRRY